MNTDAVHRHLVRFLGKPSDAGAVNGVTLWEFTRPEFCSVATVGLSALPVTAPFPQEIVCSVLPGQEGAAHYVVEQLAGLVTSALRGLINDDVIPNGGVLLTGTEICGVLVGGHPYLADGFDILGAPPDVVEFMTAIPVTQPELDLAESDGVEKLIERLEDLDPPLLDVTRRSAI